MRNGVVIEQLQVRNDDGVVSEHGNENDQNHFHDSEHDKGFEEKPTGNIFPILGALFAMNKTFWVISVTMATKDFPARFA